MAYRKKLITISYHYDDDTGMYQVGELDYGFGQELEKYIDKYGRNELFDFIRKLPIIINESISESEKRNKLPAEQAQAIEESECLE